MTEEGGSWIVNTYPYQRRMGGGSGWAWNPGRSRREREGPSSWWSRPLILLLAVKAELLTAALVLAIVAVVLLMTDFVGAPDGLLDVVVVLAVVAVFGVRFWAHRRGGW